MTRTAAPRTPLRASALALALALAPSVAAAACPDSRHEGQRITISGTIASLKRTALSHSIEIRGCPDFIIFTDASPGCRVGGPVRATGTFWQGDDPFICDPVICRYFDMLDDARVSCG